jgi:hypothetical protein
MERYGRLMTRACTIGTTRFVYEEDLSEKVKIYNLEVMGQMQEVLGRDLLHFIASWVVEQKVKELERVHPVEFLLGKPIE